MKFKDYPLLIKTSGVLNFLILSLAFVVVVVPTLRSVMGPEADEVYIFFFTIVPLMFGALYLFFAGELFFKFEVFLERLNESGSWIAQYMSMVLIAGITSPILIFASMIRGEILVLIYGVLVFFLLVNYALQNTRINVKFLPLVILAFMAIFYTVLYFQNTYVGYELYDWPFLFFLIGLLILVKAAIYHLTYGVKKNYSTREFDSLK